MCIIISYDKFPLGFPNMMSTSCHIRKYTQTRVYVYADHILRLWLPSPQPMLQHSCHYAHRMKSGGDQRRRNAPTEAGPSYILPGKVQQRLKQVQQEIGPSKRKGSTLSTYRATHSSQERDVNKSRESVKLGKDNQMPNTHLQQKR